MYACCAALAVWRRSPLYDAASSVRCTACLAAVSDGESVTLAPAPKLALVSAVLAEAADGVASQSRLAAVPSDDGVGCASPAESGRGAHGALGYRRLQYALFSGVSGSVDAGCGSDGALLPE